MVHISIYISISIQTCVDIYMGNPKLPPRVREGIFWKYCDFFKQDTETILYCSKLLIFLQWCRQAQTILAHREQWAAELAKQIATLSNEIRTFVEKPASDLCLLEGLTVRSLRKACLPQHQPRWHHKQQVRRPVDMKTSKTDLPRLAVVANRRDHVPDDLHASRSKHAPTYVKIKGSHVIDS